MPPQLPLAPDALVALERRAIERLAAAALGHELKNLLMVAQASREQLARRDGEGREEDVRSLGELLERMAALADALSETGNATAERPVPLDVADLVERTVLLARGLRPMAACSLRHDVEATEPAPWIVADPGRMRALLLALLLNAGEATAGQGRIEIRAARRGDSVRLEVADDGPGISEADRARVFEPFFTTRAGGSGLGLFLARTYAEDAGGRITLGDAEPGGAHIVVELPARGPGEP